MSWEYLFLKRELKLSDNPVLSAFEDYCVGGWQTLQRMEWSVKVRGQDVIDDRFVHVCRVTGVAGHERLEGLLRTIGHQPTFWPIDSNSWRREVVDQCVDVVVGYAGDKERGIAALKVYYGLIGCSPSLYESVRLAVPGAPDELPPGSPFVGVCGVLPHGQAPQYRFYVSYQGMDLFSPEVREYLSRHLGVTELPQHPRIGVGFKESAAKDLVYLKLAPGRAAIRSTVVQAAARHPLLAQRVQRVTWCALPLTHLQQPGETLPAELNLYVDLPC